MPIAIECSRNDKRIQERSDIVLKEFDILKRLDKLDSVPYPLRRPALSTKGSTSGYKHLFLSKVRLRLMSSNPETNNTKPSDNVYLTCYKPVKINPVQIPNNIENNTNEENCKNSPESISESKINSIKYSSKNANKLDKKNKNNKKDTTKKMSKINKNLNNNENDKYDLLGSNVSLTHVNTNTHLKINSSISQIENTNQNANIVEDPSDTNRLTTVNYNSQSKFSDTSNVWNIIVFAGDVVVLTNDNMELNYRTIGMNTDLFVRIYLDNI